MMKSFHTIAYKMSTKGRGLLNLSLFLFGFTWHYRAYMPKAKNYLFLDCMYPSYQSLRFQFGKFLASFHFSYRQYAQLHLDIHLQKIRNVLWRGDNISLLRSVLVDDGKNLILR
jgi:hypothetical protein